MQIRIRPALIKGFVLFYAMLNRTGLAQMTLVRRSIVQGYFLYKRYIEDALHPLLKRYPTLVQGGAVLDVGANIGYTASVFARFVSVGSKVIAFEPDASNFEILQEIAERDGFRRRIEPVHAAVGDTQGQVELMINESHHGDHKIATDALKSQARSGQSSYVKVPMFTVDAFLRERPDIGAISCIKIDVQGYEIGVCRGMEQTLTANPDAVVIFEYSRQGAAELGFPVDAVPLFFRERGYHLYSVTTDGRLQIVPESDDCATLLERGPGYTDLVASRHHLSSQPVTSAYT